MLQSSEDTHRRCSCLLLCKDTKNEGEKTALGNKQTAVSDLLAVV